ncbi:hypothetical protein EYF80_042760 [Liparis tanakae]|uniref:Uncharacterized protein n=1 Tax=Liparis tanakae TaxID=230148 RepID=A0A4Z2G0I6_9TELE|nr:hypothetical protein EYF80_042760 [Liparis tanakae]
MQNSTTSPRDRRLEVRPEGPAARGPTGRGPTGRGTGDSRDRRSEGPAARRTGGSRSGPRDRWLERPAARGPARGTGGSRDRRLEDRRLEDRPEGPAARGTCVPRTGPRDRRPERPSAFKSNTLDRNKLQRASSCSNALHHRSFGLRVNPKKQTQDRLSQPVPEEVMKSAWSMSPPHRLLRRMPPLPTTAHFFSGGCRGLSCSGDKSTWT